MPTLNRALWFNGLVDDDGSGTTGTIWQKVEVGKFMDTIDAALVASGYTPAAHAASHKAGGSDPIKLDEFAAPTDVVTLNASTAAHGLLPKLPGTTTTFFRGDGTYATVAVSTHAATHAAAGGDPVTVTTLAGFPGGTTTFLRADGTFAAPTGTTPAAHAASHASGGGDAVTVTTLAGFPGGTTTFLRADGTFALPPGGTPSAHAASHAAAGSDPVTVTTLAGFPGGTTSYLRADGVFATPPGGGGTGTVSGPATSVVGNVATWNDTAGTVLADSGKPIAKVVTTQNVGASTAGHLAAFSDATATVIYDPGVTVASLERVSNRDVANGYPSLNASGKIAVAQLPSHATTHKSGGSDAIKLDELAAPTDVTTLDVSTIAHGLAPKLPNDATRFLNGTGNWSGTGGAFIVNSDTGAQNNWAPAGMFGTTFIKWNGVADLQVTGLAGATGATGQRVTFKNVTTNRIATFAHASTSSAATNRFTNYATSAATPVAPGGTITWEHDGLSWQIVGQDQGAWITPAYNASDFTGDAAMTWTVDSGDVLAYAYWLKGRTLLVKWKITTTSIGGTLSSAVKLKIPGGFTAITSCTSAHMYGQAGAFEMSGALVDVSASTTQIYLYTKNFGNVNYVASTNTSGFYGEIAIEVG